MRAAPRPIEGYMTPSARHRILPVEAREGVGSFQFSRVPALLPGCAATLVCHGRLQFAWCNQATMWTMCAHVTISDEHARTWGDCLYCSLSTNNHKDIQVGS